MTIMSSLPFAELAARSGFVSDPRFAGIPAVAPEAGDPLAAAWRDGHAAGYAEAETAAREQALAEDAARTRIELSLARLDGDCTEDLHRKLLETVEALCEAALAPLARDRDALAARVERAAAMLARADDERVLHLHPDDLALVASRLPPGLEVRPDPALEPGALRLEGGAGGIEDGPGHWHRAIIEALGQC